MDMLMEGNKAIPFGSDECGKFLRSTYKDCVDEVAILNDNMYEYIEEYDYVVIKWFEWVFHHRRATLL